MSRLSFLKSKWAFLVIGLLVGVLVILAIRFATYAGPKQTHYHANFAVYINGQREQFKGPQYYQEIAACTVHGPIQPAQRAHMHDGINSVIHVHDDGVTWSQFFDNLGWSIGPNFIQNNQQTMYVENGDNKLNIELNGQNLTDLTSIANRVIKDRDRMLISFGDISNNTLQTQYNTVPATAKHYDETPDPASCAGQMEKVTISDRFHHLF
jgi:hypothetical protein